MTNAYDFILAGRSAQEVLKLLTDQSEEHLTAAADNLSDEEFARVQSWTLNRLTATSSLMLVASGGLLYCYRAATKPDDRQPAFRETLSKLGISKTKAYAAIQTFEHFGKHFAASPSLVQQFPAESLKILSANDAPPTARQAAIAMAERHEYVSMRQARELVEQYAVTPNNESAIPLPKAQEGDRPVVAPRALPQEILEPGQWVYHGHVAQLTVEIIHPRAASSPEIVLRDLESALAEYRHTFLRYSADTPPAAEEDAPCLAN